MSVDYRHPQFARAESDWKRCRDVVAGEREVHEAKTAYLPKLTLQTDDDYKAYVDRASFYNATGRTIEAMTGMLFRKPPKVDAPDAADVFVEDMTMEGIGLTSFADTIAEDVLSVGRAAVLVDFPRTPLREVTQAQAEATGLRPFCAHYTAEQIINWRIERGTRRLMFVVLVEWERDYGDGLEPKLTEIRRVLKLTATEGQAEGYVQEIWIKADGNNTGTKDWVLRDTIVPLRSNKPLAYIPFFFIGPQDGRADVVKPPILDLVNVNLSHYRTTADLEHGAHYTALPTAYVSGVDASSFPTGLAVGAARAWLLPAGAKAEFLEFTGQGLGALEKIKGGKEAQMATLGGRMLAPEKRQVESGEAAAIHREADTSILGSLAMSLGAALTAILNEMLLWSGVESEATVEVSTDFMPASVDASMLTALVSAVQQGKMSFDTFYRQLQRGEIADPTVTAEDELDRIEESQARLAMTGAEPSVDELGNPTGADPEDDDAGAQE